ncbi:MAG: GH3 auxin-responsive promoter family protein [Planctomycetes bacterium]|nr:GH3 auxin-responsive promoter family protein [Planctomycetota bacterium]
MDRILGWVFDTVMSGPVGRFQRAVTRPFATQEEGLRRILMANAETEFGRDHDFAAIAELTGPDIWKKYRKVVPIRSYTGFSPFIDRMKRGEENVLIPGRPDMFSLTSGTTSEPKFCPVNKSFIREHHRQHLLWMYRVYTDHPAVNAGKYLVVASPAEMGRTDGDIPYGAMSGKQLDVQSIPVRRRMAGPSRIQHLADAEDRWLNLLLFALAEENIRVVTSVNPSTLVAMAGRLNRDAPRLLDYLAHGHPGRDDANASPELRALAAAFTPNPGRARALREILRADGQLTPAAVWPHLELLLTWQGGASSFYLPHVKTLWGNTAMRCLGLRASEGTFTLPTRDNDPAGVLAIGGHVMEFIPAECENPREFEETLLPGQLEEGGLYRLVITTSGGFYRYDLADLVRVTGFVERTPEVAFERRAGAVLSATGEKITEDQVVAAMDLAAEDGPLLNGFSVTYEVEEDVARYVLIMEVTGGSDLDRHQEKRLTERVRQLVAIFDDELMHRNIEYQGKRDDGRLAKPRAVLLETGSYDSLRQRLAAQGKPENQIKQPILIRPDAPGKLGGAVLGMTISREL